MEDFLQDFQHKEYLIFVDIKEKIIFVVLKKNIEQDQILKAYFHACLCGVLASMSQRLPIVSFFLIVQNCPLIFIVNLSTIYIFFF